MNEILNKYPNKGITIYTDQQQQEYLGKIYGAGVTFTSKDGKTNVHEICGFGLSEKGALEDLIKQMYSEKLVRKLKRLYVNLK